MGAVLRLYKERPIFPQNHNAGTPSFRRPRCDSQFVSYGSSGILFCCFVRFIGHDIGDIALQQAAQFIDRVG